MYNLEHRNVGSSFLHYDSLRHSLTHVILTSQCPSSSNPWHTHLALRNLQVYPSIEASNTAQSVVLHVRNSNIRAPTVSAFALAIPSIAVRPIDVPILILNRLGYQTCCTRADAGMLRQFWFIFEAFSSVFVKLQSWTAITERLIRNMD